jgi:two-component system phosphate regulon sensor histidine kinase PhoR
MLKTDFVNNMAHELKTPVSTAQITLDALDKYSFIDDKVKSRQYLSIINRELSRLSLLIDNLINKTIVDDDFEVYEYSVIDIVALSKHVVQSFTPVFEQFNVRFTDSYNPGKICISGDRNHLANVLYNILDNAVKYRTARPEITFIVERKEKAVQITLQDNGIGIADRENEKVFEKFFRGTNKTDSDKGHGLGLYYVKQVIVQHQGTIRFVKTDQNLTTLLIELPLYYAGDC